jgi:hypothetical protein
MVSVVDNAFGQLRQRAEFIAENGGAGVRLRKGGTLEAERPRCWNECSLSSLSLV